MKTDLISFDFRSTYINKIMNFKKVKINNLIISKFQQEFLTPRYVNWLNDPIVVKYSEQRHLTHTIESCTNYFHSMQKSDSLYLSIESLDTNLGHIGNISVAIDSPNSSADVSILIGEKRAWGHGFATQAWIHILHHLLENEKLRRVTAGAMEVNLPMLSLMSRSGMAIDGIRPRHFIWEGKEVSLVTASKFSK